LWLILRLTLKLAQFFSMQACLLPNGTQVVVFGGEDSHRRPLSDVYILDLQVMAGGGRHSALMFSLA
jgi:hypothetical protein